MHRVDLNEATMICQCLECNKTKNYIISEYLQMKQNEPPSCCDQEMNPISVGVNLVELSLKYLKRK